MNPHHLLDIAKQLAQGQRAGRPREVELRRAISTAYYAIFHMLAGCCANMLVGATRSARSQQAWRQTYRALQHGQVKKRCMQNQDIMRKFPQEIQDFGARFIAMQKQRERADYDPLETFFRTSVLQRIQETEKAIAMFESAHISNTDRRAFAIFVLFDQRA